MSVSSSSLHPLLRSLFHRVSLSSAIPQAGPLLSMPPTSSTETASGADIYLLTGFLRTSHGLHLFPFIPGTPILLSAFEYPRSCNQSAVCGSDSECASPQIYIKDKLLSKHITPLSVPRTEEVCLTLRAGGRVGPQDPWSALEEEPKRPQTQGHFLPARHGLLRLGLAM